MSTDTSGPKTSSEQVDFILYEHGKRISKIHPQDTKKEEQQDLSESAKRMAPRSSLSEVGKDRLFSNDQTLSSPYGTFDQEKQPHPTLAKLGKSVTAVQLQEHQRNIEPQRASDQHEIKKKVESAKKEKDPDLQLDVSKKRHRNSSLDWRADPEDWKVNRINMKPKKKQLKAESPYTTLGDQESKEVKEDIKFSIKLGTKGTYHFRVTKDGWVGNVVQRIRAAMGNPPDRDIQTHVLPSAINILERARSKNQGIRHAGHERLVNWKVYNRLTKTSEKTLSFDEQYKNFQKISVPTVSCTLKEAIEGGIRFLLAFEMEAAKELLTIALHHYPQDLRLYKLLSTPYLHDRNLGWRPIRLREFLHLLEVIEDPDAEIWALKGGISKALWKIEKDNRLLAENSISYYATSFELSLRNPMSLGFGATRAAILCAELALTEMKHGSESLSNLYRKQCCKHLNNLLTFLTEWSTKSDITKDRYFHYNRAFANFGLKNYEAAVLDCKAFAGFIRSEKSEDDLEEYYLSNDLSQWVFMILFSGVPIPDPRTRIEDWHIAWLCVQDTFKARGLHISLGVLSGAARGKIGLALSGGGIRAAYVHLGLLARLAECDVLRSVEAISAVSGGTLVGALYYLLVKDLFARKNDCDITREDFIDLVKQLIDLFQKGTDRDLYIRTCCNPISNLLVNFGNLTRTHLMAWQYHLSFFSYNLPRRARPLKMRSMPMRPQDWKRGDFNPRIHNWQRENKVPALYLNCTTLNTGHLWRFTPMYMGETVDFAGDTGMSTTAVLVNTHYKDCKHDRHRDITLADAVATSSCVPGLFDPYTISGLYKTVDKDGKEIDIIVKLVDGGVYDNYGLQSLYHSKSDFIVCSDASLHLKDSFRPLSSGYGVLRRCLKISMDLAFQRILEGLQSRQRRNGVAEVCFVHLGQKDEWEKLHARSIESSWRLIDPETKTKAAHGHHRHHAGTKNNERDNEIHSHHPKQEFDVEVREDTDEQNPVHGLTVKRDPTTVTSPQTPTTNTNTSGLPDISSNDLIIDDSLDDSIQKQRPSLVSTPASRGLTKGQLSTPHPATVSEKIEETMEISDRGVDGIPMSHRDTTKVQAKEENYVSHIKEQAEQHRNEIRAKRLTFEKIRDANRTHDQSLYIWTQNQLNSVRTSLDRFTEVEGHALMAMGYNLCSEKLKMLAHEQTPTALLRAALENNPNNTLNSPFSSDSLPSPTSPGPPDSTSPISPSPTSSSSSSSTSSGTYLSTNGQQSKTFPLSSSSFGEDVTGPMESHVNPHRRKSVRVKDPRKIVSRLELKPLSDWTDADREAYDDAHKLMDKQYHWGHFDVNTPENKDWVFWPIKELIDQETASSTNPGVLEFKRQLRYIRGQFGSERIFERHRALFIVMIVLMLGALIYGCVIAYQTWVHSFTDKNCYCFLAGPIYYLTLILGAFILLGQPGYLGRFIWSVVLFPTFGVLHLYLFDPYLAYVGKTQRLLDLYNRHVTDPSKKIFTPQQKRLAEIEALKKSAAPGGFGTPAGFARLVSQSEAQEPETPHSALESKGDKQKTKATTL